MKWTVDDNDPVRVRIATRAAAEAERGFLDGLRSHGQIGRDYLDGEDVSRAVHVINAVDAIITDGDVVVMIKRNWEPGLGKWALPGGFVEPGEDDVCAAAREAFEECGYHPLDGATEAIEGDRNYYRPHDVRIARVTLEQYKINAGDIFTVSTRPILFRVSNFDDIQGALTPGSDASDVRLIDAILLDVPMAFDDHRLMVAAMLAKVYS